MKAIYKFNWYCGRMGDVEGLFTEEKSNVDRHIGKEVYFGEILGKHSEVYGTLNEDDLEIISEDQDFVEKFVDIMGFGTISGYNPIEYIEESEI
jgi:hypothetical protein